MDPVLSSQFSDWLNLRGIQAAGGIKRNPKKLSAWLANLNLSTATYLYGFKKKGFVGPI